VIDRPEVAAPQQGCQLGRIDRVILVAVILGDQPITTRIADHQRVHLIHQIPVQPSGQRPFFQGQMPGAPDLIQGIPDRPNRGRDRVPPDNPAFLLHRQFRVVAMHVGSNIIDDHDAILS
jgi:hypothetical protein